MQTVLILIAMLAVTALVTSGIQFCVVAAQELLKANQDWNAVMRSVPYLVQ